MHLCDREVGKESVQCKKGKTSPVLRISTMLSCKYTPVSLHDAMWNTLSSRVGHCDNLDHTSHANSIKKNNP